MTTAREAPDENLLNETGARPPVEKAAQQVARRIVRDIVNNRLEEGASLPDEGAMLEHYHVARPTLREALRILEVNGLITIRTGRGGGPKVRRSDPRDLGRLLSLHLASQRVTYRETHGARRRIEPTLAGHAATKATESERQLLAELLHETESFGNDPRATLRLGAAFHQMIAGISHEPVLGLVCRALYQVQESMQLPDRLQPRWAAILSEHGPIGEAIIRGDAIEAERLMAGHMDHYEPDERDDWIVDWF